ncbi:hypothetical protein [Parachryseolinea silvisoli]|uniref:hypothetical protein n=1 Tax=Parachryseolinea silvisoli TaxID=2873601 RepID=UPI002265ADF6|nr:hypothetical protein [Parachryseolinea silvisoli]MCD9017426.1 hypothetical protein [Parachryseolinea silvisoli]
MRLGQLARKLSVSPAEVTALLASKNIQIEEGINTRLTDEQLTSVLQHYGKALSTVTLAEEHAIEEGIVTKPEEQTDIIAQKPVQEASLSMTEQAVDQVVISESAEQQAGVDTTPEAGVSADESPTLIKAPKVELSGLRILGKIELPQPKKKEVSEKQEGEAGTEKLESPVQKDRRQSIREDRGSGRRQPRNREGERPRKNPVAAQREREAREAEENRQELARQEKERRTQYYQQRVKASVPTKPARLFNEEVTDMRNDQRPVPKGWFGRLLRWFKS